MPALQPKGGESSQTWDHLLKRHFACSPRSLAESMIVTSDNRWTSVPAGQLASIGKGRSAIRSAGAIFSGPIASSMLRSK